MLSGISVSAKELRINDTYEKVETTYKIAEEEVIEEGIEYLEGEESEENCYHIVDADNDFIDDDEEEDDSDDEDTDDEDTDDEYDDDDNDDDDEEEDDEDNDF